MLLRAAIRFLQRRSDTTLALLSRLLFGRSWRRFLAAAHDPQAAQTERLLAIVGRNKDTVFGREHRFSEITDFESFRTRVPIRGYDELEPYIRRMVDGEADVLVAGRPYYFARTSGTTGAAKYVPVTKEYLAEYRAPRRIWMRQVMQTFPGLVRGKILGVHSPMIEGRTQDGTPFGSITIAFQGALGERDLPRARELGFDPSPRSLFALSDFERRYYIMLRLATQDELSLAATINPSTLVLLAKKLDEHAEALADDLERGTLRGLDQIEEPLRSELEARLRPNPEAAERIRESKRRHEHVRPGDVWPSLVGLLCWKGGSAPFYLRQLEKLFPGRQMMDYGYIATEGGFSVPLSSEGSRGVVAIMGHVIEFVPEEAMAAGRSEPALLADQLEIGQNYRVIVTGSHGLYRYDINDVVQCVGRFANCAEIEFVHKGGNMLSITGEKVGESHVVRAVDAASAQTEIPLAGFCVTVELTDPPRYVFAVEAKRTLSDEESRALELACDRALREANMEYAAKRDSFRLGDPVLKNLEPGVFEAERKRRVAAGASDSHVKPPHLVRDLSVIEGLGRPENADER